MRSFVQLVTKDCDESLLLAPHSVILTWLELPLGGMERSYYSGRFGTFRKGKPFSAFTAHPGQLRPQSVIFNTTILPPKLC